MKNQIKLVGMALVLAAGFSSCEKDDIAGMTPKTNSTIDNSTAHNNVKTDGAPGNMATADKAIMGSWQITSFTVNGADVSKEFMIYQLSFMPAGVIKVSGTGTNSTGTWVAGEMNGNNTIKIDMGPEKPLSLLNADWAIVRQTPEMVEMEAKTGDDGVLAMRLEKVVIDF